MIKDKKRLLTQELFCELKNVKHFDEYIQKHEEEFMDIKLHSYLYELLDRSGYTISMIIDKASIGKSLAYQIFNGKRTPNRNLLLRIALVLKLNLEDTQRLLRMAKRGELYPRIQRDAAIIFCIEHSYSLIDTNELLENLGEAILLKED
jgi:hypothetical protein